MTNTAPRKFSFDTEFDGDRIIAPVKAKRFYTPDEVEMARAQAFMEGERSAVADAEALAAHALAEVTRAVVAALGTLAEVAHSHRSESARLALAAANKIAGAALDRFPEAPVVAALDALSVELMSTPRLVVRTAPESVERVTQSLERAAQNVGLAGQIVVKTDPELPRAAFSFDWGDGRASFNAEAAAARVGEALEAALAAEGLHAEPLPSPILEANDE
ncbi:MAG: flagellar assembly protein FliH [Caulobacteraceae bacterium]